MNIFKIFQKKKIDIPEQIINAGLSHDKQKDFVCHYCNQIFNIDIQKVFSTQVTRINSSEIDIGKAYICPFCSKINIIG